MAANWYVGVEGVARKIKNGYVGVEGVARKIKNGYVGVEGVARKFLGLDVRPNLADNDWATIAAVSEAGLADTYWSVGDEKDITLSTGETLTLVIVDFKKIIVSSTLKYGGIVFGTKLLLPNYITMFETDSTVTDYRDSKVRTYLSDVVFKTLPVDLLLVIKKSMLPVATDSEHGTQVATDNLFLFSEYEVFGLVKYSYQKEGSLLSYFTTTNNRKKIPINGSNAKSWWLRSLYSLIDSNFCLVGTVGIPYYANAKTNTNYVCFGFLV